MFFQHIACVMGRQEKEGCLPLPPRLAAAQLHLAIPAALAPARVRGLLLREGGP